MEQSNLSLNKFDVEKESQFDYKKLSKELYPTAGLIGAGLMAYLYGKLVCARTGFMLLSILDDKLFLASSLGMVIYNLYIVFYLKRELYIPHSDYYMISLMSTSVLSAVYYYYGKMKNMHIRLLEHLKQEDCEKDEDEGELEEKDQREYMQMLDDIQVSEEKPKNLKEEQEDFEQFDF